MIHHAMITTYLPSGFPVIIYSLLLGVGVLIGLWLSVLNFHDQEIGLVHLMICMLGTLLGARVAHVLFSWSYYRSNISLAFSPVQGGFDWFGAVVGGIVTSFLIASIQKLNWFELLDRTAPLWYTISAALWLGTFLTGQYYGPTSDAWYAIPVVDEWGSLAERAPIQILGVGGTLLVWVLLDRLKKTGIIKSPGKYFGFTLIGLMSIFTAINGLRVDPNRKAGPISLDTYLAISVIILIGLIMIYSIVAKSIRIKQWNA